MTSTVSSQLNLGQVKPDSGNRRTQWERPPVIYIVDDDEAVRVALRLLVHAFGWRGRTFASARELLDALTPGEPDCLLLDLNMPGMNGVELQEALRARGVHLPVIVITGHKDSPLIARARAAGAVALITKPFQDEELKRKIEHALGLPG